ncbi:hypothetical protein F5Y15DRAFT_426624 [Xylariaceae sp. FL0016]|nr:hypothetical protein F5Y15DRAFT_426624 [Xylariaceae sp. FL0016]
MEFIQPKLEAGISLLEGFTFSDDKDVFDNYADHIYGALISLYDDPKTDVRTVHNNVVNRVSILMVVCMQCKLFFMILSALAHVTEIDTTRTFIDASEAMERSGSLLTDVVDRWIEVIDDVASARPTRGVRTLVAPKNVDLTNRLRGLYVSTSLWPPSHFSTYDIAVLGEVTIRKQLFGVTNTVKAEEEIQQMYPHDQSDPVTVRKYLSWLALTEKAHGSNFSLFLAPVAFLNHTSRVEWHHPTGHKSRLYATVREFLEYACAEFRKDNSGIKSTVVGLLTPWFFDIDTLRLNANKKNQTTPIAWEKTCFRAGLALFLTKVEKKGSQYSYRLTLFKPDRPAYPRAAEPPDRRDLQDQWIAKLLNVVDEHFDVVDGWIGGKAAQHEEPDRSVPADSVEVSSEIITEVMENPSKLPSSEKQFLDRGFSPLYRYD